MDFMSDAKAEVAAVLCLDHLSILAPPVVFYGETEAAKPTAEQQQQYIEEIRSCMSR